MKGYISAYQEHRDLVMLSEMVMYQSSDNMHNVFTRIESILARPDRPTAIICYHDQIAIRVIDLVRSMGLKIPEDISIFGFDNYKLAKYISPKLSTVEHPKETMGRDAAKTIFDIIEGRPYEKNKVYDPELIIRESIKKI
jgi:GntR family transcriptional regulator of arabinose operon